ncbi:DMT family transporter [Mycobacterium sp. MBM]|nr:DMT family transporter [Mycobacterium sp. MBM]
MTRTRVDLTLLAVAVVWGSSYLAAKEAVDPAGVLAFLAVRFGIAVVMLAVLIGPRIGRIGRRELLVGSMLGLILSVICLCETYGVTTTSASNAGLIMALTVVITPLLGGRRDVPRAFYVAAVAVLLGCIALTQAGGFTLPRSGDLLIAAAAVLRAAHVVALARASTPRRLDTAAVTLVQLATVSLVTGAPAVLLGQFTVVSGMSSQDWVLTGYLAAVCTVFAFGAQLWAARFSTPARMSLLLGTEPLWAMAIGVGLAGDPVTVLGVLGAALILGGTAWGRVVDSATISESGPGTGGAVMEISTGARWRPCTGMWRRWRRRSHWCSRRLRRA